MLGAHEMEAQTKHQAKLGGFAGAQSLGPTQPGSRIFFRYMLPTTVLRSSRNKI